MQAPIGMGSVQFAIHRHHLWFEPKAKLKPKAVHITRQWFQSFRKFTTIDKPVAQGRRVIIPDSEPTIVQHEQLYTKLTGFPRDRHDFIRIEVEISTFPVVNEHRSRPVTILP